jgi:septal ring factor EnvC (AmiA/AmiB activator)
MGYNPLKLKENAMRKSTEQSTAQKLQEWRELKKKQAVLSNVNKMLTNGINELEAQMLPIIKCMDNQQDVVDNAIIEYKSRKTKGVKYEAAFNKALEICNKSQRKVLNEFLDSVTTKGVNESLKIADPEITEFSKMLKDVEADELLAKMGNVQNFPRLIINKKKRDNG